MIHLARVITIALFAGFLQACSFEASIEDLNPKIAEPSSSISPVPSSEIIGGEKVITPDGSVFVGVFGEVSEKKQLPNGVIFQGSFYQ